MTATPPQGTDRDALHLLAYEQWLWSDERPTPEQVDAYVDRILALVRPVGGVTLTPEECADLLSLIQIATQGATVRNEQFLGRLHALTARLEASL